MILQANGGDEHKNKINSIRMSITVWRWEQRFVERDGEGFLVILEGSEATFGQWREEKLFQAEEIL